MPVAEILVLGGFLFIYSLEELTHLVLVCTGNLSSGHGHSHEEIEVPVEESIQVGPGHWSAGSGSVNNLITNCLIQATSRGFLIVLALCIHDFFEGIALGVCKTQTETYFLLAAFASHKWVIAGTVGLNWARSPVGDQPNSDPLSQFISLAETDHRIPLHDGLLWDLSNWYRGRNCSQRGICRPE